MKKQLATFVVCLALSFATLAQPVRHWFAQKGLCYPTSKVVLYVNGVHKPSEMEVMINALDLHEKLSRHNIYNGEVHALYNGSEALWKDLAFEAFPQKVTDAAGFAFDFEVFALKFQGLLPIAEPEGALMAQWRAHFNTLVTNHLASPEGVALLDQLERDVQRTLDASNKVAIVAHSQGNFIANSLHSRVVAANPEWVAKGLSIVNVASPSAYAPSNLYLTSIADLVMGLVPANMPANLFVNPLDSIAIDPTGHGFTEIYLSETLHPLTGNLSVMRLTLDMVASALIQGEEIPRCCGGMESVLTEGATQFQASIGYGLMASDNPTVLATGHRTPFVAVDTFAFQDRPYWGIAGNGDQTQVHMNIFEQLEFRPRSYHVSNANSWIRFSEPRDTNTGEALFEASAPSYFQVDVAAVRPRCIEYNYPSDGTTNVYDRTDAPWASVWTEVTGHATWTMRSTERATCAMTPGCQPQRLRTFDNGYADFDFGPVLAPVRIAPSTVEFY